MKAKQKDADQGKHREGLFKHRATADYFNPELANVMGCDQFCSGR
jgi:hypothetical protein